MQPAQAGASARGRSGLAVAPRLAGVRVGNALADGAPQRAGSSATSSTMIRPEPVRNSCRLGPYSLIERCFSDCCRTGYC